MLPDRSAACQRYLQLGRLFEKPLSEALRSTDRCLLASVCGTPTPGGAQAVVEARFADGTAMLTHHMIRLGFMGGWKSIVAADQLEKTFATLERNLNAVAEKHDGLSLTIPIACMKE